MQPNPFTFPQHTLNMPMLLKLFDVVHNENVHKNTQYRSKVHTIYFFLKKQCIREKEMCHCEIFETEVEFSYKYWKPQ